MNSLRIALFACAALAPMAIAAPASADWYGKVSVGQSEAELNGFGLDAGLTYGAALGTAVGPLRVEAGVDRISGDIDLGFVSANADALDFRASAFLDLPIGDSASIYAGGGVDYVDGEAGAFGTSIDASGTGWHWAVGGAYRLTDRLIGEAQVRQLRVDDLDAGAFGSVDLDATLVTVGLRFEL